METKQITFQARLYEEISEPFGCLPRDVEASALWHYYGLAVGALRHEKEQLPLEDEPDYIPDFQRLYRAAAMLYSVDPNSMGRYWPAVNAEIDRQNLSRGMIGNGRALLKHLSPRHQFSSIAKIRSN